MARPHGFDHFCSYLKGLEAYYVVIGGGAASILMDDEGLEFRLTKDVDLLVLSRSQELNARILAYVKDGGYNSKESTDKLPRYYRFQKPTKGECPKMIEIFARNELELELEDGQHIIPIADAAAEKLSAILLDDEYFELIQKNMVKSESGIPLVSALANICLKARAAREIFERREAGDRSAKEDDIVKHLKDIWRLGVTLNGNETISLTERPAKDVAAALAKLKVIPDDQFKQATEKTPGVKRADLTAALVKVFPEY